MNSDCLDRIFSDKKGMESGVEQRIPHKEAVWRYVKLILLAYLLYMLFCVCVGRSMSLRADSEFWTMDCLVVLKNVLVEAPNCWKSLSIGGGNDVCVSCGFQKWLIRVKWIARVKKNDAANLDLIWRSAIFAPAKEQNCGSHWGTSSNSSVG